MEASARRKYHYDIIYNSGVQNSNSDGVADVFQVSDTSNLYQQFISEKSKRIIVNKNLQLAGNVSEATDEYVLRSLRKLRISKRAKALVLRSG